MEAEVFWGDAPVPYESIHYASTVYNYYRWWAFLTSLAKAKYAYWRCSFRGSYLDEIGEWQGRFLTIEI